MIGESWCGCCSSFLVEILRVFTVCDGRRAVQRCNGWNVECRLAPSLGLWLGASFCPAALLAASWSCPELYACFPKTCRSPMSSSWSFWFGFFLLFGWVFFSPQMANERNNLPCEKLWTKYLIRSWKHFVREIQIMLNRNLISLFNFFPEHVFSLMFSVSYSEKNWRKW